MCDVTKKNIHTNILFIKKILKLKNKVLIPRGGDLLISSTLWNDSNEITKKKKKPVYERSFKKLNFRFTRQLQNIFF